MAGRWFLPFDHPIYFSHSRALKARRNCSLWLVTAGATAVLMTAGALRQAIDEVGDLGIIMRIDATISQMGRALTR